MKTIESNPVLSKIPRTVFGASSLGNLYRALPDETKLAIVSQWIECSEAIVAIDSAGKYGAGLALEWIGKALRELSVDPSRVLISNKLGWRRVPLKTPEPTFEPGAWVDLEFDAVQDISGAGIQRCWEQGCELLGVYRPQLVSVHDPDEYLAAASDESDRTKRWNDIVEAYEVLKSMRDRGEVAAIGVGSKDWTVSQRLTQHCDLDWVMLATSLTVYRHDPDVVAFVADLHDQGIAVINSAVFQSGFLTGGDFFDYRPITGQSAGDQELLKWRDQFERVCADHQVTPAQACVAFGMTPPGVVATALNSSQPARIRDNVELTHFQPPANFWTAMKQAGLIRPDYPHVG